LKEDTHIAYLYNLVSSHRFYVFATSSLLGMKCFFQFYYSGNFYEALNDATAAVNLEPTSIKAIKTGKILDSTDL